MIPKTRQPYILRTLSAVYSPSCEIEAHSHSWHQLLFASSGAMTLGTLNSDAEQTAATSSQPTQEFVVPSHRAVWVEAGVRHTVRMTGRVAMRTLYFPPADSSEFQELQSPRAIAVSPLLRELILHAVELGLLRHDDKTHRALTTLLQSEIEAAESVRSDLPLPADPRALAAATELLRAPRLDVSLKRLARDSGASDRTLERLFVRETGLSFGRWRRRALALSATRELAGGNASVEEISVRLGYESTSAFIAAFKRELGMTPGSVLRDARRSASSTHDGPGLTRAQAPGANASS